MSWASCKACLSGDCVVYVLYCEAETKVDLNHMLVDDIRTLTYIAFTFLIHQKKKKTSVENSLYNSENCPVFQSDTGSAYTIEASYLCN